MRADLNLMLNGGEIARQRLFSWLILSFFWPCCHGHSSKPPERSRDTDTGRGTKKTNMLITASVGPGDYRRQAVRLMGDVNLKGKPSGSGDALSI